MKTKRQQLISETSDHQRDSQGVGRSRQHHKALQSSTLNFVLEKEFQRTVRFNVPLSILIVSIDQFIQYSHTEGPKSCIRIIQQLAKLLDKEMRAEDYLGRSWGGEFISHTAKTSSEGALILAKRIKPSQFNINTAWQDRKHPITISQGIGCFLIP